MGLTLLNFVLVVIFSLLMAVGQLIFKFVSVEFTAPVSVQQAALRLAFNPWFWTAAVLYGLLMVYWIWLLSRVPVSIAYPVSALSLVIVPIFSWLFYSESLSLQYWLGLAFLLTGIFIITR